MRVRVRRAVGRPPRGHTQPAGGPLGHAQPAGGRPSRRGPRIRHVPRTTPAVRAAARRPECGRATPVPAAAAHRWDRHTLTELPHPARAAAHQRVRPSHTDRGRRTPSGAAAPAVRGASVRATVRRPGRCASPRRGRWSQHRGAPDLAITGVGSTRDPRPRASAADDPVLSAPIAGGSTADTRTSRSSDHRGAPATRSGGALGLSTYGPRSSGDRAPPSGGGSAGSNPAGGTTLDLQLSLSVTAMNNRLTRSRGMVRGTNSFHEPLHASDPSPHRQAGRRPRARMNALVNGPRFVGAAVGRNHSRPGRPLDLGRCSDRAPPALQHPPS